MILDRICTKPIVAGYSFGLYANLEIVIQLADCYVNVSKLCQDQGKKFKHWLQFYTSYELIFACAKDSLSNTGVLHNPLKVVDHKNTSVRGLYIHPNLLPSVISWLSPDFAIMANYMVNETMNVVPRAVSDVDIVHYHQALTPQETTIRKEEEEILVPLLETLEIPPLTTLLDLNTLGEGSSVVATTSMEKHDITAVPSVPETAASVEPTKDGGDTIPIAGETISDDSMMPTPVPEVASEVPPGESVHDEAATPVSDAEWTYRQLREMTVTQNQDAPDTEEMAVDSTQDPLSPESGDHDSSSSVNSEAAASWSHDSTSSSDSVEETATPGDTPGDTPKSETTLYEMAVVAKRYSDTKFPYYVVKSEKQVMDRLISTYNKNYPNAKTLVKLEYIPGKPDLYGKLKTTLKLEAKGNHFYTSLSEEQLLSDIMTIYAE